MEITGKMLYEAARPHLIQHGFEDVEWEDFVPGSQDFYDDQAEQLNKSHIAPLQALVTDLVEGLQDCWDNEYSLDDLNDLKGRAQAFLQGDESLSLGTMPFDAGVAMAEAITAQGEKVKALQGLARDLYNTIDEMDAWYKLTDTWYESLQKRFDALCGEKKDAHAQGDTAFLLSLLTGTAEQLEEIAKAPDIDTRQRRFMGMVQPVFYMLGRHYPELEPALSRIGRAFVEV